MNILHKKLSFTPKGCFSTLIVNLGPVINNLRERTMIIVLHLCTSCLLVVSKMGILAKTSNYQKCIKKTNKIPDYARDFKNEYLFIRGINKECEKFVEILGREEIFKRHQAVRLMRYFNKFLKAQHIDYLNDTIEIKFKYEDVKSIESLELQLDDYRSFYFDEDRCEIDEEKYNNNVENDFPGLKKFFECFSRFNDKINVDEVSEEDYYKSLIYDSDDDDDYNIILSDSDDSDSDY